MPSAISEPPPPNGITKFVNCRLARGGQLVSEDLWVDSKSGTILPSQKVFFDDKILPSTVVDLGGRIIAPGLIDVQLNGAFGFNFSTTDLEEDYATGLAKVNKKLVATGVTSYLPTLTTQNPELYQKVLPLLRQKSSRSAHDGAESLGAHVEGPFLNPGKNGIHDVQVMREASSFQDIEACYGADNLVSSPSDDTEEQQQPAIRKITLAPERGMMTGDVSRCSEDDIGRGGKE